MVTKTKAGLDFLKANWPEIAARLEEAEADIVTAQATADAVGEVIADAPVDAVASTNTLTSDNLADVDPDETVTVNGKVYTFKAALTPAEGEVLIAGTADGSLTNLASAINHTGTPDTDYKCAAAHPTVSSSTVSAHALTLSALTKGTSGDALTLATDAATLTAGNATFQNGVDGTVGTAGQIVIYNETQPYICLADATVATAGAWKKLSVAAL